MQKIVIRRPFSSADLVVLALILATIYALVAYGRELETSFRAAADIDLSVYSLPYYTLFSALRGIAAFGLSLCFTLIVGYSSTSRSALLMSSRQTRSARKSSTSFTQEKPQRGRF
jgi:hypothetical protein